MELGLEGSLAPTAGKALHVNFEDKEEMQDRKKKYLTAKYGPHQMGLIKKRLRVEMWMYEQLQYLFATNVSGLIQLLKMGCSKLQKIVGMPILDRKSGVMCHA